MVIFLIRVETKSVWKQNPPTKYRSRLCGNKIRVEKRLKNTTQIIVPSIFHFPPEKRLENL